MTNAIVSVIAKNGVNVSDTSLTQVEGNKRLKITMQWVRIHRCGSCGEIGHYRNHCNKTPAQVPALTVAGRLVPVWRVQQAFTRAEVRQRLIAAQRRARAGR